MDKETRIKTITNKLQGMVDSIKNSKIAMAPGRINLIGEHTDYNEGFVFPCAVSKETMMAAVPSSSNEIKAFSLNYDQSLKFSLDELKKKELSGTWIDYLKGVAYYLEEEGHEIGGMDCVFHSTVPIGGGLSSSAALEVATVYVFNLLYNLNMDLKNLALIAFKAERQFMKISCGIMDQFISCLGKENNFLFLDCRPPYEFERIELSQKDVKMVIMDTKVHHATSRIVNIRREECFKGVEIIRTELNLNIRSLRDVSIEQFEEIKNKIPQPIQDRCAHIIYENQRVLEAKKAIQNGDFELLGRLMHDSHHSLDALYEVSCKELNTMVKIARKVDGVIGARMTGAGLGGCTCCLCHDWAIDELITKANKDYEKEHGMKPDIYSCEISDGVKELTNKG